MTDRPSTITSHQSPSLRQKLSVSALILALCLAGEHSARAASALFGDWIANNYTTGATTWADSSGNGHTATAIGTLSATNNAFGTYKGINFAGGTGVSATGYFSVANSAVANSPSLVNASALTLVAVMRPTAAGVSSSGTDTSFYHQAGLIGNEQANSVNDWDLGFGGSKAIAGVGNPDTTLASNSLTLNQSYVEIATWDSTVTSNNLKIYINGNLVASVTTSTNLRDANGSGTFALGANTAVLTDGDRDIFTGLVAELQIYNDIENVSTLNSTLMAKYSVVPEPSTWFGGAACAGLAVAAWRRRWRTAA